MSIKRYTVTHESGLTGQLYERVDGDWVKFEDLAAMTVTFDDAPQAAQIDRAVEGMQNPPKLVFEDECAANMNGHNFGRHGPNGEVQCEWCGAPKVPVDPKYLDAEGRPVNWMWMMKAATVPQCMAVNARIVQAGITSAREHLQTNGVRHSWIDAYVNIAKSVAEYLESKAQEK